MKCRLSLVPMNMSCVDTALPIFKLKVAGHVQVDEMETYLRENSSGYYSQYKTSLVYLERFAGLKTLPAKKISTLTLPESVPYPVYELRTKDLRVYVIRDERRRCLVLLLGKKTKQKEDLKTIKSLVIEYQSSIEEIQIEEE